MNKRVKNALTVILICFMLIIPFYHPEADSGFDGSYSGGSSGGFSSSWSGGSSWGSSSGRHYYSSGSSDPIGALIALGVMLVIVAIVITQAKKKITSMPTTVLKNLPPYNLEELKSYKL